jgi:hypothetical protein
MGSPGVTGTRGVLAAAARGAAGAAPTVTRWPQDGLSDDESGDERRS